MVHNSRPSAKELIETLSSGYKPYNPIADGSSFIHYYLESNRASNDDGRQLMVFPVVTLDLPFGPPRNVEVLILHEFEEPKLRIYDAGLSELLGGRNLNSLALSDPKDLERISNVIGGLNTNIVKYSLYVSKEGEVKIVREEIPAEGPEDTIATEPQMEIAQTCVCGGLHATYPGLVHPLSCNGVLNIATCEKCGSLIDTAKKETYRVVPRPR